MNHRLFSFSSVALALAALCLIAPPLHAQVQSGSPLAGQNGAPGQFGMSPHMAPNGPLAPQNNAAFTKQHVSDSMRENLALEIQFSQMALKNSRSAAIKKFANQVIAENRKLDLPAKELAPDQSGTFPNPMYGGTREAVESAKSAKDMKNMTGVKFDRQYLTVMNGFTRNDQQVGHSAYAMFEFPPISPLGRKYWDMANARREEIDRLGKQIGITFPR